MPIQLQKRVGLRKQLVTLHQDARALDERHKALLLEHRRLQQAYAGLRGDHDRLLTLLVAVAREHQDAPTLEYWKGVLRRRSTLTVDAARLDADLNGWGLRTEVIAGGRVAVIAEPVPPATSTTEGARADNAPADTSAP